LKSNKSAINEGEGGRGGKRGLGQQQTSFSCVIHLFQILGRRRVGGEGRRRIKTKENRCSIQSNEEQENQEIEIKSNEIKLET